MSICQVTTAEVYRAFPGLRKLFKDFPTLKKLLRAIDGRVVGGGVRNPMLGEPVSEELDLASPYTPYRVMQIGARMGFSVVPIKIDHGTVLLVRGSEKYEVTTLRRDVLTDGRWARVAYTKSWQEDAQRRDFTINAMYMDARGRVYDYNGGIQDIANLTLRFVGDAATRIKEDYLRIIRMFRFWAYYAKPTEHEVGVVAGLKSGLAIISKERILSEMLKLYRAQNPWSAVASMYHHEIVVHSHGKHLAQIEAKCGRCFSDLTRLVLTVDTTGWPVSKQQRRWRQDIVQVPQSFEDVLERMHLHGAEFGYDYTMLYMPELLDRVEQVVQAGVRKMPLLPSELPIKPGPEMGLRYKAAYGWWVRQFPSPSKQRCLDWYHKTYGA